MKKLIKHMTSVHIDYHCYSDKLFKIVVGTVFYHEKLAEFFLPRTNEQLPSNISSIAVKYRLKKDFGITYDNNSATYHLH